MTTYEEALDIIARYYSDSKRDIKRYTDDEIIIALGVLRDALEKINWLESDRALYKELAIHENYSSHKAFPDSIMNVENNLLSDEEIEHIKIVIHKDFMDKKHTNTIINYTPEAFEHIIEMDKNILDKLKRKK